MVNGQSRDEQEVVGGFTEKWACLYAEHGLGVLNVWAASSLTARLILCLKPFPDVPGSSFAIGRRGGTPFWMYLCLTSGSDLGCDSGMCPLHCRMMYDYGY